MSRDNYVRRNNTPSIIKTVPDNKEIVLLLTLLIKTDPAFNAIMDINVKADITAKNTTTGGYLNANTPLAICVLSPHSERKTNANPEMIGFRNFAFDSVSELPDFKASNPKTINNKPDASFKICSGIKVLIIDPKTMADPSTNTKAKTTPDNS